MAAINTVTLIGRVVRDIEVNLTNSGKSVALHSALTATARMPTQVSIDCVAWNKAAGTVGRVRTGKQIADNRQIANESGRKMISKRKATEAIIDQFQLLSDAKGGSNTAIVPQNDMLRRTLNQQIQQLKRRKLPRTHFRHAGIDLSEIINLISERIMAGTEGRKKPPQQFSRNPTSTVKSA